MPCAAFGNGIYLVAWQSGRAAPGDLTKGLSVTGDIVACRVDTDGNSLDTMPLVICGANDLQERPRVASDGKNFLVVWQDLRNGRDWDVYAARITAEGKVLDPGGFLVASGAHNQAKPQIAWDGQNFLVVWQDFRNGKQYEVYAARVASAGTVLDADGARLASGDFFHCHDPAVASTGGGRSLVLWLGFAPFAGDGYRTPGVMAQFVTDGKPDGPARDASKAKDGPGGRAAPVWMAAGKDCYLAAWKTDASLGRGNADNNSHATVFNANGERQSSLVLASGGQRTVNADVAWDGTAFVAVWTEYVRESKKDCPSDVTFSARVSTEGKLLGEARRLAGTKAGPAANVCVASDGAGNALVAYEQHPASGDVPIQIEVQLVPK
jgi:hypothetical protein